LSSLQVIATIIPPLDWLQAYHTISRSTSAGASDAGSQVSTTANVHESRRPAQQAEGPSPWIETWIDAAGKGGSVSPPNSMISAGHDSGHEVNDAGSDRFPIPRPGFSESRDGPGALRDVSRAEEAFLRPRGRPAWLPPLGALLPGPGAGADANRERPAGAPA